MGQIIPWNVPILMAAWKLAPAIGAGRVAQAAAGNLNPATLVSYNPNKLGFF